MVDNAWKVALRNEDLFLSPEKNGKKNIAVALCKAFYHLSGSCNSQVTYTAIFTFRVPFASSRITIFKASRERDGLKMPLPKPILPSPPKQMWSK